MAQTVNSDTVQDNIIFSEIIGNSLGLKFVKYTRFFSRFEIPVCSAQL